MEKQGKCSRCFVYGKWCDKVKNNLQICTFCQTKGRPCKPLKNPLKIRKPIIKELNTGDIYSQDTIISKSINRIFLSHGLLREKKDLFSDSAFFALHVLLEEYLKKLIYPKELSILINCNTGIVSQESSVNLEPLSDDSEEEVVSEVFSREEMGHNLDLQLDKWMEIINSNIPKQ